ncbi:MAG: Fe(2+) transporter permease subunit FeoB [Gammaproteobacteria bacterium]|jgi:ferrous iron transport protein B|nr:Fe(2+) transporter permease subunit FeoB [Gammaproteobacteria bacterium]
MSRFTIGIIGNPNSGKSTLFNSLTGSRQRVGNWSGVTVDRKEGSFKLNSQKVTLVDLPGIYSLSLIPGLDNIDEAIARQYVRSGEPDLIINILDASNLERNLYLTTQLLETGVPMLIGLNMMDMANKSGVNIDLPELERMLGCPVVPLVCNQKSGLTELKQQLQRCLENPQASCHQPSYDNQLEKAIEDLGKDLNQDQPQSARWMATALLESDPDALLSASADLKTHLQTKLDMFSEQALDVDMMLADGRYQMAHHIATQTTQQNQLPQKSLSDRIDHLLVNRWLGLPIFLAVMYALFLFTINLGGAFIDVFDQAAGAIFVTGSSQILAAINAPQWLTVIIANGIGGGIQVVATFIPIVGFLFIFLTLLEDSGYMARAAFIVDRFIRAIGLPGKAFMPLIVGFGCNVPSIMASRTLESQRDRILTVAMAPFMSCGARLAVYALFAAAFFPQGGQNMVFALYLIGIAGAILTGFLLRKTLLQGEVQAFVMELPAYHLPNIGTLLLNAWQRLRSFMLGAGKIIVVVVTILSFLNSLGKDGSFGNEGTQHSVLSNIGQAIVPIFTPMGIDDNNWPATVGIFTGIFAKEAVVGTLDALYQELGDPTGASEEDAPASVTDELQQALQTVPENLSGISDWLTDPLGIVASGMQSQDSAIEAQGVDNATFGAMQARFHGQLGAFVYLLFILLYFPCVAAIGAIHREVGPRWAVFIGAWTTGLAYIVSVSVYQLGTFNAHPTSSALWLAICFLIFAGAIMLMRHCGQQQTASIGQAA